MQRILGYLRKAVQEFDLIQKGDRIAVGVSGGKDSVVLLTGLCRLRRFLGVSFDVVAITLDPGFGGVETDYSPIAALCEELGVPYIVKRTQIGEVVFDVRKEANPCSLCAKMRRGALHDAALEAGCNKVALGHHYNDAVETFVMNLFNEGRLGCFSPKSYLSIKKLWLIRPMVFAPEKEIRRAAEKCNLPIVKSKCPADGHTNRETTKEFLRQREREDSGFTYRLFGAMRRAGIDGWGYPDRPVRKKKPDAIQDFVIEAATAADLPAVAPLAAELYSGSADSLQAEFAGLLARPDAALFAAKQQEQIIGFAQCQLRHDYVEGCSTSPVGYLEGVYVSPAFRQAGVGRSLECACEDWAKKLGCTEFASDCALKNTESRHFHDHLGFAEMEQICCFMKPLKESTED